MTQFINELLINKKRHLIMINRKAPDHDKDDEKEANAKE